MAIAIQNATIVTVDERNQVIPNGLILIEANEIAYIGPKDRALPKNTEIIDARGMVAMPGLINCHTHAAMTYFRGIADDRVLMDGLEGIVWPAEQSLKAEHVYHHGLLACLEMIRSGTTTFVDQYFFPEQTYRAVEESGIRAFLAPPLKDYMDEELGKKLVEENLGDYLRFNNTLDGRVHFMLGPHAPYSCSRWLLCECKRLSDQYGMLMHIHIAEVPDELAQQKTAREGMTSTEFLDEIGFLCERVLAAHSIWLTAADIETYKKRGVRAVYNPTSNMKISAGISPVPKLMEAGITVALGTDSAYSNNTLDMFEAMKTGSLLQKVATGDPTVLPAATCVRMATIEGAKALGIDDRVGSIEAGKLADIILVNFSAPHLQPWYPNSAENVLSHLIYCAKGADVDTVIINGKVLMKGRKMVSLDQDTIIENSRKAANEILRNAGLTQFLVGEGPG